MSMCSLKRVVDGYRIGHLRAGFYLDDVPEHLFLDYASLVFSVPVSRPWPPYRPWIITIASRRNVGALCGHRRKPETWTALFPDPTYPNIMSPPPPPGRDGSYGDTLSYRATFSIGRIPKQTFGNTVTHWSGTV